MLPFQMIAGGTYTVTGAAVQVELQSQDPPDFIVTKSITGWGEANDAQGIEWWWERSMAQGLARGINQTSSATPAMQSVAIAADGRDSVIFSSYNTPSHTKPVALARRK